MIRFAQLVEAVAHVYGLSAVSVRKIGEALQAERLIPVGGRGRGGRLLTPEECAPLTLAPLACSGPSEAVAATCRVARLPVFEPLVGVPDAWEAVRALPGDHTLGMLIEALLEDAAGGRLAAYGGVGFIELRVSGPCPIVTVGPTPAARDIIESGGDVAEMLGGAMVRGSYIHRPIPLDAPLADRLADAEDAHDGAAPGALITEKAVSLLALAAIGERIAYAQAARAA